MKSSRAEAFVAIPFAVLLMTVRTTVSSAGHLTAAEVGNVTDARVLAEAPRGRNWLVLGGNFGSRHYSPLRQINARNVARLSSRAWDAGLCRRRGVSADPHQNVGG